MNVMNRKLFANRDARRKLANMGGIVTSSPELINTVQSFRRGGRTITFGNTKLVLFDDGEMYAELEDGRRVKLNETQKAEINALLKIRSERRRDEVIEKGATAKGPGVFADTLDDMSTVSPEVSEEVEKQSRVLKVLAAGKGLAETAKEFGLGAAEVADIAGGYLGLGFNELSALTGEGIATLLNAAGVPEDFNIAGVDLSPSAFAREAGDIRQAGRGFFFDEGNLVPRVTGIPLSYIEDRIKADEEQKALSDFATQSRIGPIKGALTTPEQRAKIAAQSDAAIKRASPETLRDTGESVGFTGTTDLLSATPKSGVMSSLGGSEVLFDLLQGGDTVPDKTASVGFEGGASISSPRDSGSEAGRNLFTKSSGIMSQAPGISVPNVDIGEAGLENARQQADLRKFIATENPEFYNPLVKEMGQRAREYYDTDTFTSPELIYSGDVRDILKREEASSEEIQAASDRLAREAAADEAAKVKQQFGDLDAEAQAQRDAEIAEQQAMLDEDDATLNPSQKIVKEFQRQVDVLKKERADRKKVEEDQGFYTEEDEKIPVKNPEFQELLKGPSDKDSSQEKDSEKVIEELDKAVDKENKKTGGGSPASAGANVFLDAAGVDSSNMTLKEKVTSMKEIYTDLLGYDDEEESELFWLNMAQIGFLVASGQDPNALSNIAAGFAQGASKFAEDKRDKKARDDKMTLAAFSEVMDDERAKTKFGYDKVLAGIRASGSSSYSTVDRMFKSVLDSSLASYKTQVEDGTITNEQAVDKAMKDASTAFPDSQFAGTTKLPPEETVDVIQNGKTIKVPVSQIPTQQKVLTEEKG
jgi:hypothetical protein